MAATAIFSMKVRSLPFAATEKGSNKKVGEFYGIVRGCSDRIIDFEFDGRVPMPPAIDLAKPVELMSSCFCNDKSWKPALPWAAPPAPPPVVTAFVIPSLKFSSAKCRL